MLEAVEGSDPASTVCIHILYISINAYTYDMYRNRSKVPIHTCIRYVPMWCVDMYVYDTAQASIYDRYIHIIYVSIYTVCMYVNVTSMQWNTYLHTYACPCTCSKSVMPFFRGEIRRLRTRKVRMHMTTPVPTTVSFWVQRMFQQLFSFEYKKDQTSATATFTLFTASYRSHEWHIGRLHTGTWESRSQSNM